MPQTVLTSISELTLDLLNFRTVPQESEMHAIQAMITASPDRFWALTESIIDSGYLPTENILVLKRYMPSEALIVKEGNRRVAALKLILGLLFVNHNDIPAPIATRIAGLSEEWRAQNMEVPCAIYDEDEAPIVDRIVTLAHGKNEKAGRDQWNAIARARHNRAVNKAKEHYLDLLEKYLEEGRNLTLMERDQWASEYPITVLEEAMKRIAAGVSPKKSPDLARQYPNIQFRDQLEVILHEIGTEKLGFKDIRSTSFLATYGILPSSSKQTNTSSVEQSVEADDSRKNDSAEPNLVDGSTKITATAVPPNASTSPRKPAAAPIEDQKSVKRQLKHLRPIGENRKKVVTLRDEAIQLDLTKTPLAFCFVLRSMFEISAKAYCEDHLDNGGPKFKNSNGNDRQLAHVLKDIYDYMTAGSGNKPDVSKQRALHGAHVELAKAEGILSVNSMNQLIHNPSFTLTPNDICRVFANIFPLLEAMN